ncbi:MAG: HlyD family efflux transporter periplasmic adaptor subunit, partial [Bacilli bacterium]|nr:HlyD family efflux transporter periplasmic adaptor subunit [Bacilli bacterium]
MRRLILTNVVVILLIIGIVGGLYYYFWNQSTYISTDDAQVSGRLVTITPQVPGKLTKWSVNTGDTVTAGQ